LLDSKSRAMAPGERLRAFSAALDEATRSSFERVGAFVAARPWQVSSDAWCGIRPHCDGVAHAAAQVIAVSVVVAGLLSIGIVNLEVEVSPDKLWTPAGSTALLDRAFARSYFPDPTKVFFVYSTAQRSRPDKNLLALSNVKGAVLDTIRLRAAIEEIVAPCATVRANVARSFCDTVRGRPWLPAPLR
jgi:hypothetical protein